MSKKYGLIFTNADPRTAPAASLAPTLVTFWDCVNATTLAPPGITKMITTLGLYTFDYTPTIPIYFLADGGTLITDNNQRYLSGMLDPIQDVDELVNNLSTTLTARNVTLQALGNTSVALGTTSVALGTTTVAIGTTNFALGTTNVAIGTTAVAGLTLIFNQDVTLTAIGTTNFALGTTNVAIGTSLTALGNTILATVTLTALNVSLLMNSIGSTASSFGTLAADPVDIFGYLKRLQEFNEGSQQFDKTSGVWNIESRSGVTLVTKTLTNTSSQVTRG